MPEFNRLYAVFVVAICAFSVVGIMSNSLFEVLVGVIVVGLVFVASLVYFVVGHVPRVTSHTTV